jgi:DNA-binding cell septation regulator SpoVG
MTSIQQRPSNFNPSSAWVGKVHCAELYDPPYASNRILACAPVTLGLLGTVPILTISGLKILAGRTGVPFVAAPSEKRGDAWIPLIEMDADLKAEVQRVVLDAYAQREAVGDIHNEIPF